MSRRFRPGLRLTSRHQFVAVQDRGQRIATKYLTMLGLPNSLQRDRLGLIASRKFGGAVQRNRAKRRLREVFRHMEPDAAAGTCAIDIVAIPRRALLEAPFSVVDADFRAAVRRLRREA